MTARVCSICEEPFVEEDDERPEEGKTGVCVGCWCELDSSKRYEIRGY